MTIEQLVEALNGLESKHVYKHDPDWPTGDILVGKVDHEAVHGEADDLLLEFINDPRVTEAFNRLEKWYA